MRFRFGVAERVGPFWAGVSMSPKRYNDYSPHGPAAPAKFGCGCALAAVTVFVGVSVAVAFLVGFLVLLL
jgi:hypothetical protein